MTSQKFKQTEIGKIPKEWEELPANKFCVRVTDGTHDSPKKQNKGKYLITSKHIKEGKLDFNNAYFISEDDFVEVNKRSKVNQWDLIFGMIGTIGEIYLEQNKNPDYAIKNVGLFKTGSEIKGKWLFYFLKSMKAKDYIFRHSAGTTQQYMTLDSLRNFPIDSPKNKNEMESIASILSSLDAKIELNNKMNKTLEEMGQAIFKNWFTNKEEIPEGWKTKPLDEIAEFLNGLALQKYPAKIGENFLPVIKIRELRSGITSQSDKANLDLPKNYIVNNGDILFSWSGSLEVVIWTNGKGALNQHLFKISSKEYPKWFYYFWTKYYLPEFRNIAEDKATTMGHIQRIHLTESEVLIPDKKTFENMNKLMIPLIDKIINLNLESQTISQIRDVLLPKLMSGEIRVK